MDGFGVSSAFVGLGHFQQTASRGCAAANGLLSSSYVLVSGGASTKAVAETRLGYLYSASYPGPRSHKDPAAGTARRKQVYSHPEVDRL